MNPLNPQPFNLPWGKIVVDLEMDGELAALQSQGKWEWRKVDYIQSHLKPGQTFVDAGAYNGYFSILAAHYVKHGEVWAFEPDMNNAPKLQYNIKLNNLTNVHQVNAALGAYIGEALLYPGDHAAMSSIKQRNTGKPQKVNMWTLDAFFNGHYAIDMLKIDVEGADEALLWGAVKLLKAMPHMTILMDLHPHLGVNMAAVDAILRDAGFSLFDIRSDFHLIQMIPPTLEELLAVK